MNIIDQLFVRAIVREEIALDELHRQEAASPCPRCAASSGRTVPGVTLEPPPGTQFFTADRDAAR